MPCIARAFLLEPCKGTERADFTVGRLCPFCTTGGVLCVIVGARPYRLIQIGTGLDANLLVGICFDEFERFFGAFFVEHVQQKFQLIDETFVFAEVSEDIRERE